MGSNQLFTSGGGGSGGGGGGSLVWVEDDLPPVSAIDFNLQVYQYAEDVTQKLYALIRIPSSYNPGSQINLKLLFYSGESSGNVLMQTITTLIRTGVDAVSSTTNQRTSTNSALTMSAGTVAEPQAVTCDLTSSTGQVNSVSVAAGDLLKVQLSRGTDTANNDVNVPIYGSEVTFS